MLYYFTTLIRTLENRKVKELAQVARVLRYEHRKSNFRTTLLTTTVLNLSIKVLPTCPALVSVALLTITMLVYIFTVIMKYVKQVFY